MKILGVILKSFLNNSIPDELSTDPNDSARVKNSNNSKNHTGSVIRSSGDLEHKVTLLHKTKVKKPKIVK
jgi:hypothetical protein